MYGNSSILKGEEISLMKKLNDFETVYDMIEHALELAYQGKMQLKFYEFLKYRKTTKAEIDAFLQSSTAKELANEVLDLEEYIKGGADNDHKQLREAYHHIPKPQARKIKNYLSKILEDAVRYRHDRRPGRRKKQSK
jgi:molybdenum cofactor biosynthesis enzyme MoaA